MKRRILSIVLCLALFIVNIPMTVGAASYEYTLKPDFGTFADTTFSSNLETIKNYSADDQVTVFVSNKGTGDANNPKLFGWRNDGDEPHKAVVTFTTASGEDKATIYSGEGANFSIYGPTVLKNIKVFVQSLEYGICTAGHSLTIDSTAEVGNSYGYDGPYIDYAKIFVGGHANQGTSLSSEDGTVLLDGISLAGGNGGVILGGYGYVSPTIPGNQTVISKNNEINLIFAGSNDQTIFSKNLNVVLENATVNSVRSQWSSNSKTTVNGAIQILANGTSTLDADAVYAAAKGDAITAGSGVYVLDSSNKAGTLAITDVAGTYTVNSDHAYAYAYDALHNASTIYYGTDTLTIGKPGNYEVNYADSLEEIISILGGDWVVNLNGTITSGTQEAKIEYYITPNGAGDQSGRSESNAAPSITAAVQSIINDGYGEGDKVTIYVVNSASSSNMVPNFTWPWPNINDVSATTLASITVTTKPGVTAPALISYSEDFTIVANMTFKNVTLVDATGGNGIFTNGYNVTFDEDVTFKQGTGLSENIPLIRIGTSYEAGKRYDEDATLTINNTTGNKKYKIAFAGYTWDGRAGSSANTLFGRKSVVINGGDVEELYLLGLNYKAEYNSDINIVLNGANLKKAGVSMFVGVTPVIGGALQFISNNGATLPNMSFIEDYAEENKIPYYELSAVSGANGTLSVTENAGTYTVESEKTYVCAYSELQPDTMYYSKDVITVNAQGKYFIGYLDNLSDINSIIPGNWVDNEDGTLINYPDGSKVGKYYVAPGGKGDGSGRSADNAARGVSIAIQSIIDDGYGADDFATIYVAGGEGATSLPESVALNFAWPWPSVNGVDGTTLANITITSMPDAIAPALLEFGDTGFTVMANTVFKNIILVDQSGTNDVFTNGFNVTFDEDVTFKQGVYLSDYQPNIYVGSCYSNAISYESDATLTINNTSGNKNYAINFGGYSWNGADGNDANFLKGSKTVVINGGNVNSINLVGFPRNAEYDSDINVVLNGAKVNAIAVTTREGFAPVIGGALQFVVNNGSSIPNMSAIKAYANEKNVPYYFVNASSAKEDLLSITNKAGTYAVMEGYTAVAVNDDDTTKKYASLDGELVIPAGEYTVSMLDNSTPYICDGKIIEVFIPSRIDFSKINPDIYSVDDKVFVGWKNNTTGEYATNDTLLNIGDVLEAQYIDCTDDDFGVVGTEIRTVGADGLRFIVSVNKSFLNKLPNVTEKGSIVLPTDNTRGRDLFLNEAVIFDWKWDEETRTNFIANNKGETPVSVVATNLFEDGDNSFKYTLCLTNISNSSYDKYYMMRGYIKYVDYNGVERIAYTEHENTSMYHTAVETVDSVGAVSIKEKLQDIIDYVEVTQKNNVLSAPKYLYSGYEGCADTDPNHKIYYQNGVYVREISVNSGNNLSSPIQIAAFSDMHFNHINVRDIEEARATTLATYRGREWLRDGMTTAYTNNVINLAKYFDKAVALGDIMDYFSWGCADVMERTLFDKFTLNKLIPILGNHEQLELMVPDVGGLSDTLTRNEIDDFLKQYWPTDLYYHSEIIKDSSGKDGVMIVAMMNGWDEYYESQKVALEADIAIAKSKNIPILIFEHNPICTRNPNEKEYPIIADPKKFGTSDNYSSLMDMQNRFAGNVSGNTGSDETTLSVYNLIVQNYDVIKGVFHAHEHLNMYTEIMAQDKEGNFIADGNGGYVTIPQYGTYSIADSGGAMFAITVN